MTSVGFCHDCSQTVSLELTGDQQTPICSRCHGEFVEIIEPDAFHEFDQAHATSATHVPPVPPSPDQQQQQQPPFFQMFPFPFAMPPGGANSASAYRTNNQPIIIGGNDPREIMQLLNSTMNHLMPGLVPPEFRRSTQTSSAPNESGRANSGESTNPEEESGEGESPATNAQFIWPGGFGHTATGQQTLAQTQQQQGVMMSFSIGPDGVPRRQIRRFGPGATATTNSSSANRRRRTRSPGQREDGYSAEEDTASGEERAERRTGRRPAETLENGEESSEVEEDEVSHEAEEEASDENGDEDMAAEAAVGEEGIPEFLSVLRQLFGADVFGGINIGGGGGGVNLATNNTTTPTGAGGIEGLPEPLMRMFGMVGNPGDYVFGNQALDDIISRMMEQTAGKNAPPPAKEEEIERLPRCKITPEEKEQALECAVCKDEFQLADEDLLLLPCHHKFHHECIKHWLKLNGTCPVCRRSLNGEEPSAGNNQSNSSGGSSGESTVPRPQEQPASSMFY